MIVKQRKKGLLDMTPWYRKYPGYFLALTQDRKKLLGKGHTPEEALEEAGKHGFKNPLLTKIPIESKSYLL